MNTTIYLIRHGEVEYKHDSQGRQLIYGQNTHLSREGEEQINRLAEKLKVQRVRFDALYTSPYARARESAKILWEILGEPRVHMRDGLHDIWAPGWVGVPMDELKEIGGDIYSRPRSEDQETLKDMKSRIFTTFQNILKETRGKTIGIVGHGDPTRALIGTLLGESPLSRIVRDEWYYGKGEAWKLEFDEKLRLLESPELISAESMRSGNPERKTY